MADRLHREDIAQFKWKYDRGKPGEGHVFVGDDTLTGYKKVWLECWRDSTKTEKCSFHVDELSAVIAALEKAKLLPR